jgi:hypothetical protein
MGGAGFLQGCAGGPEPELLAATSKAKPPVGPPAENAPAAASWHEPVAERAPATNAARKVVETLDLVKQKMTSTVYQHETVVDIQKGIFLWDCSGMVEWVLRQAAPKARKALSKKHPPAKDFYNVILGSPAGKPHKGWLRLRGPEEICPGDIFAWKKPWFWQKRKNTGHVGFVISTPQPHPLHANVWVMRVADATRMLHENDSRPEGGDGGFGTATMAFLFDESGSPAAYGWYGVAQSPDTFVPTTIAFGRVTK